MATAWRSSPAVAARRFHRNDQAILDGNAHVGAQPSGDNADRNHSIVFEPIASRPPDLRHIRHPRRAMAAMRIDALWHNARLATLADGLGLVEHGLVAGKDRRIVYAGPARRAHLRCRRRIDCGGRWITPGLIDCHTHLVHGGDRAREFELQARGRHL